MPAKITASTTDPATGKISIADVQQVINDFQDSVLLSCSDEDRNPVTRYVTFDIDMAKLQAILNTPNADPDRFRIHFSLNLPGQRSCDDSHSIENKLSILISGIDATSESEEPLLNVDDLILVDGFKEFRNGLSMMKGAAGAGAMAACCVQGRPPR